MKLEKRSLEQSCKMLFTRCCKALRISEWKNKPKAAQATLFARGKVKHYLHYFTGLRRIIAYHSSVNSSECIIVYPHVACCLCTFRVSASKGCCSRDQRIRAFTTLTALFAFYFQDRKRSHPLYLVRLELSNILHCMASLDLSDVQRFLGDWNLSSLALHVTFAVLWELDKAGAILKSLVSDGVPPRAYYLLFLSLFVSSCLAALELWQPRHPARGSGIQEHAKSLTGK